MEVVWGNLKVEGIFDDENVNSEFCFASEW